MTRPVWLIGPPPKFSDRVYWVRYRDARRDELIEMAVWIPEDDEWYVVPDWRGEITQDAIDVHRITHYAEFHAPEGAR